MRKKVEIFDKATFEAALPRLKANDKPAWVCAGLVSGEYVYLITLGDKTPAKILVRSSVDQTNWSRATGEDSIRVYVVDKDMKPLSGKSNRWTTRLPGWQERMNEIIRFFAKMAIKIGNCPRCSSHGLLRLNKVKKAGPNKGRWFLSCTEKNCYFEWQDIDNDDNQLDVNKLPQCPGCDKHTLREFTVKKDGPNKGRVFLKCSDTDCNYFQWTDESENSENEAASN